MLAAALVAKEARSCVVMDHGVPPGGKWGMPSHVTPGLYQSQMQGYMTRVRSQIAAIAGEKDPTKRDTLLREHY